MKKVICTVVYLLAAILVMAQTGRGKVAITIVNEQGTPVEGATAELLRHKDSALVKSAITDKGGLVEFENSAVTFYIIRVSGIALLTAYSNAFEVKEGETTILPPMHMAAGNATQIGGVTVAGRKPFIQRLNDRLIINVDNSTVNAGSSAFEVLERSPGVTIDQNDNLALRGRQGVRILIDGKPSPMSGADLANYLKGLPVNAIERIEIITNPSSKYEAAGNSGIIDIRMKKDQRLGSNGTLTAGYGQGVYPKWNAGTTLNYRNKNINVFGNYNYAYRKGLNHLILNRNFFNKGKFNGADDKDNYVTAPLSSHTSRIGADFFIGKNSIIGFIVTNNISDPTRNNRNNSVVINDVRQPAFTFKTLANNNDHNNNNVANINFKHTFKNKAELTADADYGVYNSVSLSTTATKYFKLDGSIQQPDYILNGDQNGRLTLKTAKADYVLPMKKELRFEAGAKWSYVTADNDAKFFDASTGTPVNDVNKTNHFLYDEMNNAGYLNLSKEYKKFNIQVGLRGEQTIVNTHQLKGDIKWDSSYFKLFPSAFFNYKLKEDQTLGLSLSRRINRPGYSQLNPFLFLIDVTTYATGSPGLLPEFTWSYELNYTVKQLNFTLGYSRTNNVQNIAIARFKDVFPLIPSADNVTVQIPVNLNHSDYIGLSIAAPVKIIKWWNSINNADIYYNHFTGNLGGTALNNGSPAADIRTNNSFILKKGWITELNGSFNSGGRYGYMFSKPQWGLSVGAQKTIWEGKGTIRFNITDIFWTNRPRATITFQDKYVENWHAYRESRVANLSFTYRFGSNKVQQARRRTTASEEERRRAGGS